MCNLPSLPLPQSNTLTLTTVRNYTTEARARQCFVEALNVTLRVALRLLFDVSPNTKYRTGLTAGCTGNQGKNVVSRHPAVLTQEDPWNARALFGLDVEYS